MSEKLLVVSASTGSGHVLAGEAVKEGIAALNPDGSVEHVDLLELSPRWVRTAVGSGYELMATKTPRVWEGLYRRTDLPVADRARWGPLVHRTLFAEFRKLLLSHPWAGCLCTHFLPGQLAAGTPGVPPFGMVVTDLTLHHVWAQPRVNQFFAPNQQLAAALRARVSHAAVEVTGIPVSGRFAAPPSQEEARERLGLHPFEPTVLVMGGGMGVGIEAATLAVSGADLQNVQVVVICGKNGAAAERLHALSRISRRLHVRGFVTEIESYIAAADLVVTKPGGITTSEVLSVGRPLLLFRGIPGHEEANASYLCATGAAVYAPTPGGLRLEVERLIGNSRLLRAGAAASAALGRPSAAREIARLFLERIRRMPAAA